MKRVLSRRKATLKWFEERMKGEELNTGEILCLFLMFSDRWEPWAIN